MFFFISHVKKLNLQQIRDLYVCFVRACVCKLVCVCKREGGPYLSVCIGVQIVRVLCAKHCTKSSVYKHPWRLLIWKTWCAMKHRLPKRVERKQLTSITDIFSDCDRFDLNGSLQTVKVSGPFQTIGWNKTELSTPNIDQDFKIWNLKELSTSK